MEKKNSRAEDMKISKMQKSLCKKANELSILCGIEIAIIIFSISGQPILFGKPDVELVVHHFLEAKHPAALRNYMKMKKKELKKKEKGKSIEGNSDDFESPSEFAPKD
ncbi:putative LRR receptor-like serine/threonine-protein kinase-like [Capsicum annuum]|uniref:agamous-like MADS-box protein AGL29 n=1 Tax=Capsicum annuum TaxID=4072 RepID=UPI0007BF5CA4|nr:agamous-like MADS-box protein AGL29 [Capsicum annuum]KAF3662562.1 putative LRR receptor-like serine/threonine-protein kinase-like [Capsicum annuum]KAF3684366.1 putative LRR receptor-like serine/threonine-protein kinase-like [Capsicum annuum]